MEDLCSDAALYIHILQLVFFEADKYNGIWTI